MRDRVGLLARDVARLDEPRHVDFAHRRLLVDERVHARLGVAGLVALVVPVLPVAVHVDDDVLLEALAELHGEARHLDDGLRVLTVHVENRDAQHARDVRAVARRPRIARERREADLVVDDEVDRAPGRVALELREVERLLDDALAHEGGVAVDEERHGALPLAAIDLRAHAALDDGVHELEVARVERHREVKQLPRLRHHVARVPEVVLDVALAEEALGPLVVERGEDLAHVLA